MAPIDFFTEGWLKKVAGTAESDLRAHRIALTYHRYMNRLDEEIHGPDAVRVRLDAREDLPVCNTNWFGFGTWAVVTLSREIRNQRAPARTEQLLTYGLRQRLTPAVVHLRAADGQRVSRALSWAQRAVFLNTTFGFLDRFVGADPARRARLVALTTWDGKPTLEARRHLDDIADAFATYEKAAQATHAILAARAKGGGATGPEQERLSVLRARRVLRANLMITAVEQDVVNHAVRVVVDHLPDVFLRRVDRHLAAWGERFLGVPRQLAGLELPYRLPRGRDFLRAAWARLMTDQLMVLAFPTETLRVGRDLPPRDVSRPFFPAQLRRLDPPPGCTKEEQAECHQLADLVASFDRSRGSGRGTGAHDWRRYDDRMNWAVNMLRSRQQDPTLFWCPYSEADQWRIIRGELPYRVGDPSDLEVQAPLDGGDLRYADAEREKG